MLAALAQAALMERILHGQIWALSRGPCCDQMTLYHNPSYCSSLRQQGLGLGVNVVILLCYVVNCAACR